MDSHKLVALKKAFEEFAPYVKNIEDHMAVLQGKMDNLAVKKTLAEEEFKKFLEDNESLKKQESEKLLGKLDVVDKLLRECNDVYLAAHKMKVLKVQLTDEQLAEKQKKLSEMVQKSKKIREEVNGLMLRSALRTEVRRILNDINSVLFTDAQINTWLDLGNSDAITRLGPFDTAQATITTVVNEPNYSLPSNFMAIKEVYLVDDQSKENRLYFYTQDELNNRFGLNWRDDPAGVPLVVYQVDYNVLGLHPEPNTASAGKTLRVFYYRVPSAFASDSDSPIFLDALHDGLSWYASSRGFAQLGQIDKSDWALNRYKTLIKEFWSINTRFSDDFLAWRWE